jgi:hypothetical protein
MAKAKPESSLAQNDGAMQSNIQNRRATSGVRDARHPSLLRSWDRAFRQSDGRGFGMGWRSPLATVFAMARPAATAHLPLVVATSLVHSRIQGMAPRARCVARRLGATRTKPECPLDSESMSSRLHDQSRIRNCRRGPIGWCSGCSRPAGGQGGGR